MNCESTAANSEATEQINVALPLVSIILAVLNEADYVEKAVTSLLTQETAECQVEILAIDGGSTDGTVELLRRLAATDSRVRMLTNPYGRTPHAFNIGLREARGEFVCILGCHAEYDRRYISECLKELIRHDAVGCSGKVITRPGNDSWQANLVCWALKHPFGSSGSSVRTQKPGFVDTIPYPLFRKSVLVELGGYNESLYRNQDNDMNQRLRALGCTLYLTENTHALYFVKPSISSMLRYAFNSGFWNVISLRANCSSMRGRHFVPLVFVSALLLSALLSIRPLVFSSTTGVPGWIFMLPLLLVLGCHLAFGTVISVITTIRERSWLPLALSPIFLLFHVSYGIGSLWAVCSDARPPEINPAYAQGTSSI